MNDDKTRKIRNEYAERLQKLQEKTRRAETLQARLMQIRELVELCDKDPERVVVSCLPAKDKHGHRRYNEVNYSISLDQLAAQELALSLDGMHRNDYAKLRNLIEEAEHE